MTVPSMIDAGGWLGKFLTGPEADGDVPRQMLQAFAEVLMSAQASMQCQAAYGERSEERVNSRNGYRTRDWDTRVGTIELGIPKLREGTYYPSWLLNPAMHKLFGYRPHLMQWAHHLRKRSFE